MMLRIPVLVLSLAALASQARADCERDSDCKGGRVCVANQCIERKYCMRDKDCPGDQICDRNTCIAPAGHAPVATWTPSHEQAAAQGAGMALQYTKNTWPLSIVDRPLVVAPGMMEAQIGVSKDLSTDQAVGSTEHPWGGDLYARFGVSDRIHAGLDAVSVCLSDCGPAGFFRSLSVGAGYAVVATHDMNLVPALTAGVYNFAVYDAFTGAGSSATMTAVQPGFLWGWRMSGNLQLFASGALVLGVTGRDNTSDPDILGVHLEPRIALGPRLAVAPYVGYVLPLKNTDFYKVPLGVNLLIVADRAFDLGGSFEFSDIAARTINTALGTFDTGGTGARSMRLFATLRL